jgi:hypothetical protein
LTKNNKKTKYAKKIISIFIINKISYTFYKKPKLESIKYLSERLENINKKIRKLEKFSNSIENE